MPKATRYFIKGMHYHLTHRCHNKENLLRFAKDRDTYREILRKKLYKYRTPLLGYCLTSNHVHLLVTAVDGTRISQLMDALEGDFAQRYNLRKGRCGAFWSGRYHATAIDSHVHLWNCLIYIDLNMVRAGVVECPSDWSWCSYEELAGMRKRYRLIDRHHFETAFGIHPGDPRFQSNYIASIQRNIQSGSLNREPYWSESLAVGSKSYINAIEKCVGRRIQMDQINPPSFGSGWVLKEVIPPYG